MKSTWEQDAPRANFEQLSGNKSIDVLIIGGITGILCTYKLKNSSTNCMLYIRHP